MEFILRYMNPSSWFHIWVRKMMVPFGVILGQDGHVYEMDNTESAWNSVQVRTGIYYTVLDTKAKELKPTYIESMQLNGEDMTYDAPNYALDQGINHNNNTPISIVSNRCRVQQGYRQMLQLW